MRDVNRIIVPPYERRRATADLDPDSDAMAILVCIFKWSVYSSTNAYRQPLEDRDGTDEWGLPSDVDSE
jgi:hypothetical protein